MDDAPPLSLLEEKVREVLVEALQPEDEAVPTNRPLMAELGFDSLDMIELSFGLEERFGFEFSSRNAIEEIDKRVGEGRILVDGILTQLGRDLVLERMPELIDVDLPEALDVRALPSYFTIGTFARILHDFYVYAPSTDPATGEPVTLEDLQLRTADGTAVQAPTGDEILEIWLEDKTGTLAVASQV